MLDHALSRFAEQHDDAAMAAVALEAPNADIAQLARLTRLLADGGDAQLTYPSSDVVDIASSGGPGSLSTLVAPLYACALGARVAKIAVPGRPAGGLDVLASLSGYNPELDGPAARRVFETCGYVHVAAGGAFCPLDARFFAWRQANGAQANPNLAITSLLAKKLAAGVSHVVLDIRVGPYGNLGTTAEEARRNAGQLIAVAAEIGIRATCVLTSWGAPQPWIGRGEALVALARILEGDPDDVLRAHADECLRMAMIATDTVDFPNSSDLARRARIVHESMLTAHGSDPETFWTRQRTIATAARYDVIANRGGVLQVDLGEVRRVLVERQRVAEPVAGARFPDPCGLHLVVIPGAKARVGAVLARVRDDADPARLAAQIATSLRVEDEVPQDVTRTEMEIIRG